MRTPQILIFSLALGTIGSLVGVLQNVNEAQAIPAFSRKYDFACNVCHVAAFPKLNDFGNLFRDHGYQLETDQDLPTGEGLTKGYWPVSFRTAVGYQFQTTSGLLNPTPFNSIGVAQDTKASTGGFGFTGLDIQSFGTLGRDLTFGVVFTPGLGSAQFNTMPGGESDLEFAFLKFDNVQRFLGLGSDNYLMNLKVGKYELDLPFSSHRSPTLNTPFLVGFYEPGRPASLNGTGIGFDSGRNGQVSALAGAQLPGLPFTANDFHLGENRAGAELSGITPTPGDGYFRYSLNAISNSDVNGGGTGGGRSLQFYSHVTQSIGGYGIVSGQRIGAYGMYGRAPTRPSAAGLIAGAGEDSQPFSRVGVDASLTWDGQVNVFGTWMFARDSRNLFINQGGAPIGTTFQEARWNGGFVEADYTPIQLQKWQFIYRCDWITNTQQPDNGFTGNFNNAQQHTGAIRYPFQFSTRTAAALHLEYSNLRGKLTAASGRDQIRDQTLIGLDFSF